MYFKLIFRSILLFAPSQPSIKIFQFKFVLYYNFRLSLISVNLKESRTAEECVVGVVGNGRLLLGVNKLPKINYMVRI